MVTWILQKNLTKAQDLIKLKDAISQSNNTYVEVEIIPFSTELPKIDIKTSEFIVYGSTTLMLNAFNDLRYKNGVYYDPLKFNMQSYSKHWGNNFLNSDGFCLKLSQIAKIEINEKEKYFIKPNLDSKSFEAKVITIKEIKEWVSKILVLDLPELNPNTEVFLAKPKSIDKEWRSFIVEKQIVSTSKYLDNGVLNKSCEDVPKEMLKFLKLRIEEYNIDLVYAIDIGLVESEYKIIECNCFNGTGFYDHDISKIVESVSISRNKLDRTI